MSVLSTAGVWTARLAAVLLPAVAFHSSGLATSSFFVLAVLSALLVLRRQGLAAVPVRRWALPLAALATLIALGLASALWSPVPGKSLRTALTFALLLGPMVLVFAPAGRSLLAGADLPRYAAVGLVAGLAVIGFENLTGNALLSLVQPALWQPTPALVPKFNRGFALLTLLVWPVAAWLWLGGRRLLALAAPIVVAAACFTGVSRAATTAILLGMAVALAGALARRHIRALGAVILGAYLVVLPFTVGALFELRDQIPNRFLGRQVFDRVEIWDHLDRLAWDRPLFGWGIGASGTLPPIGALGDHGYTLPGFQAAYPHNVPLEVRVDLGVVGLIPVAVLLIGVLGALGRLPMPVRPFALAAFASGLWISALGFQTWSDSSLFLYLAPALMLALLGDAEGQPGGPPGRLRSPPPTDYPARHVSRGQARGPA